MTVSLGRYGAKAEVTTVLIDLCRELHSLDSDTRREALASLTPEARTAIDALTYEWALWTRPEQRAPLGRWRWWVLAGGRGGGKTRTASEQVSQWAWENPGTRICLLAKDAGGYRRIMLLGKSGLLSIAPPWFRPRWHKTEKMLAWPNGTIAELHSSEEPQTLRGPEYHYAWVTELFHYQIPKGEKEPTAWREGIKLSLRLGESPRGIIDSSPRQTEFCASLLLGPEDRHGNRSVEQEQIDSGEWAISHELEDREGKRHSYVVHVRRWSSERNADNLGAGVIAEWRHDLRGTALEEQELDGKILAKVRGALFDQDNIDQNSVRVVPTIVKVLVAVDPTRSDAPTDEAGIVVGGLGADGHAYVWDDCSLRGSPDRWGREAIGAYHKYQAHAIVREENRMPQSLTILVNTIDRSVKWIEVSATEKKQTRAEPVSALYEQGRVHHVHDPRDPLRLALLESEMVNWNPKLRQASPNRMDALVWLIWALLLGEQRRPLVAV